MKTDKTANTPRIPLSKSHGLLVAVAGCSRNSPDVVLMSGTVRSLTAMIAGCPRDYPLVGIYSDNDSAFINEAVVTFCDGSRILVE